MRTFDVDVATCKTYTGCSRSWTYTLQAADANEAAKKARKLAATWWGIDIRKVKVLCSVVS